MAEMLLVNPRRRRKSKAAKRRRRSGSNNMNTNPRRRRRHKSRHSNPIRARRMRRVRGRRRNPSGILAGINRVDVTRSVTTAASAAIGAVALNIAWGMLPLPASMKLGTFQWVAKGVGAIALGHLARRIVPRSTADLFTLGALTVLATGLLSDVVKKTFPKLKLGYAGAGFSDLGYDFQNMGAYGLDAYMENGQDGGSFPMFGNDCHQQGLPASRMLPAPGVKIPGQGRQAGDPKKGVHGFEDPLSYAQQNFESYGHSYG